MDSTSALQLVALILLLVLSGFFSSAETSLTTISTIRLLSLAEQGNKRAQTVLKIRKDSGKMLSAILIGNNVVNLSASSLSTTLVMDLFGSAAVGIATGILTFLVLMFGEITPKTLATIHAEKFALRYANIISFLMKILTPVIFIINHLSSLFLKLLHVDPNAKPSFMTEHELRTIVDVSHENGVIESDERQMINNVFDFGDSTAKDIMIPRIDVTFVSVDASYDEVLDIFREAGYSRLPVYEGSKDHVVGIVYFKDVYFYRSQHRGEIFHLKDVLRKPFFTYETQKVSSLLAQMREKSVSFSIVLDEYGVTAGLITLEDIVEEIFGELRDEYDDSEEETFKKLSDGSYMVSASLKLDDLDDLLDVDLDSEDYDSLGGYIIELLDHLPSEGETAEDEHFLFKVVSVDKNRMETIHIIPKEQ